MCFSRLHTGLFLRRKKNGEQQIVLDDVEKKLIINIRSLLGIRKFDKLNRSIVRDIIIAGDTGNTKLDPLFNVVKKNYHIDEYKNLEYLVNKLINYKVWMGLGMEAVGLRLFKDSSGEWANAVDEKR